MANKMKMVEKHLEIVSQTNQRMRALQAKIQDLNEWRNKEKNVPSILLVIKIYDISVHTLDTTKCQDLASRFEENAKHNLAGMIEFIFSGPRSTSKMNTQFIFPSSKSLKTIMKRSRRRFERRKWYPKKIFKKFWLSHRWSIPIIGISCTIFL